MLRTPESTVTALSAVTSDKKGFSKQVESFYDSVSEIVRSKKLKSADFVRSWNFVDSILKRYSEFNAVRDARFEKLGVTVETCPAGTGIDFRTNGDALMVSFAEFRSAGSQSAPKIVRYKTPSQCEASSYGPKFSRAAYVEEGAWRRVHVSGTASVSPDGKTLNADDISANVAHTMETVRELLDLAGADFSHVVRSYAYLKKPEYSTAFEDWKNRSGVDFPGASNVCDVCRDDWLFEFECVALVPVKRGVFKVF
ncbi:MAG: Rid family hydrolase [Patescibacteria group bacterium]